LLYWQIGVQILAKQEEEGWGRKVITHLARDLSQAFPDITGLSSRNLKYMSAFASAGPDASIVQEVIAQSTWCPPWLCFSCGEAQLCSELSSLNEETNDG
jgi:hypothetical protein